MLSFFELLELMEGPSGMMNQDFSSMSLDQRMAQGRDIGEDFMRRQLAAHGVEIKPSAVKQDMNQKIDGFWNGEAVQLKLRRSSRSGSNDLAYEVVRNHDNQMPLIQQLTTPQQQGRDYKGKAKHYFIMNQSETEIYHVLADTIKQYVNMAVRSLKGQPLERAIYFQGINLRPTRDRDPNSFTPTKVMAFVPIELVKQKTYPVGKSLPMAPAEPAGPQKPKKLSDAMWKYVQAARRDGQVQFPAPNNKKVLKALKQYAKKSGMQMQIRDNLVTLLAKTNVTDI